MITVRSFDFSESDYALAIALHNRVWTDYPDTVSEWQENDQTRFDYIRWARFFAEIDGTPVGLGSYTQYTDIYHPQKFWIHINVLPELRRQGIGSVLHEYLLEALTIHDPLCVYTMTREDFTDGMAFVNGLGFQETLREWESRLDPHTVDLPAWHHHTARAAAAGVVIKSVHDLADDPARDAKLYELEYGLMQDVPNLSEATRPTFEDRVQKLHSTHALLEGWFVALHGEAYVGMSNVEPSAALPDVLYTDLTGVLRSHQRMGIATALKLAGIRFAQEQGIRELRTWNEVNNRGMLAINERLGFVRQPAHIFYTRPLPQQAPIAVTFPMLQDA